MSGQLDRIEAMLTNQGRLLVAIGDVVGIMYTQMVPKEPAFDRRWIDELRRAVDDCAPWRNRR